MKSKIELAWHLKTLYYNRVLRLSVRKTKNLKKKSVFYWRLKEEEIKDGI